MKYRYLTAVSVLLLPGISSTVLAAELLRYNPFEQPAIVTGSNGMNANNATGGAMELRGTLVDGNTSLANIGGKHYRLNEEVSGYRVTRISSGSVTLRHGENEIELTLQKK